MPIRMEDDQTDQQDFDDSNTSGAGGRGGGGGGGGLLGLLPLLLSLSEAVEVEKKYYYCYLQQALLIFSFSEMVLVAEE